MKPLIKKCLFRLFIFLSYGFAGSWIFTLCEREHETNAAVADRLLARLKKTFAYRNISSNFSDSDFNEFVQVAYKAILKKKQKDWTFTNGLGFTFPALTTVGFGDITPKTALGQGLTIPYCLIGLPLTMLALKTSGELILLGFRTSIQNFEKKILGRQNPRIGFLKLFSTIITVQALIICTFAWIEMYTDGWTFVEGVYCWFITFTTIGFGDYVPFDVFIRKNNHDELLVHSTGFIISIPYIFGLALLASLLNLLVESSEKIKVQFSSLYACTTCRTNSVS